MSEALHQLLELLHLLTISLLSQLVATPVTWMKTLHDLNYLSLFTISPTNIKQGIFREWQKPCISLLSQMVATPVTWMKTLHDLNYLSQFTISPTNIKQGIFGEW